MGGGDTLDSFVSNYHIGIRGKKWRWPNFINTIDVLKSAAFRINKMANLESNIDFLQFIRRNQIHYLRVAEISRQMRAKNIHPCKQSWKGVCAVTQMKDLKNGTLLKISSLFFPTKNQYIKLTCAWSHVLGVSMPTF